jgi:prepilin-type N-terminal cleavage/methylation domain-containing protein
MQLTKQLKRDDRGFTLIELLITVAILGIIAVPLGSAVVGFFRNTDDTTRRLGESHDAQISAAYFAQDAASVGTRNWTVYPYALKQSVEVGAPSGGGLYPCGAAGTPDAVVRFAWDDPQSATGLPTVIRVAYVVQTVGAQRQLRRIVCSGSSSPTSNVVLAHNVDPTAPTVACSTTCTDAAVPQMVTLTLSIKDPASTSPTYTITLNGQRRQT